MIDAISLWLGVIMGLLVGALAVFLFFLRKMQIQQQRLLELQTDKVRLEASQQAAQEREQERRSHWHQMQAHLKSELENLSHEVFAKQSNQLSHQNQQQLQQILLPLKERLTVFEQHLLDTYQKEARERFSLQKEIEKLLQLNLQMSEDAQRLTHALKGDSKVQGNWGELVLSRVLESSGLRAGEEYIVQGKDLQLRNEEGKLRQPDVIVQLPDDKHLIIDSKVSLTAYERYGQGEQAQQEQFLKQHLDSILTHINQLSEKHYADLPGLNAPDFVLMFLPIEPAFSLALQNRPDLFAYAWQRKIVLVSPTTLLATLKTVASLWKLEQQNHNAQEIARQGGQLYDKFVRFVEELEKIGRSLDRAQEAYGDAMHRLREGKGNLMRRAQKLQDLGARTHKQLPS